jgi:hypothetical protein
LQDILREFGVRCHYFEEAPPPKGHLHHQIIKCEADIVCPSADLIMHIDSDCVFHEPVKPESYMVNGKPMFLIGRYGKVNGADCWKPPTERALGHPVEYETMRWHPAVHYRMVYPELRERIEKVHGIPFEEYVFNQKPDFPCGFSEFNALGQIALRPEWAQKYHIYDVSNGKFPHSYLTQMWSHGGLDKQQSIWHEGKLIPVVPRNFLEQLLA